MANGDQQTVVPGVTPGTTPPTFGSDEQTQQILQRILSSAQPRPQLAQPVPAPIPQQQPTQPPAYMQPSHTWGPAWGGERLMYGIGASLHNAVAMDKQKKLVEAESDWNDLTTSVQKYMKPDGSIDPRAYQDPAVMNVLGNPKKLKNMAKSLNQDWLSPEKTTVYGEALKAHLSKQQQKDQARQGLMGIFQKLTQKNQALQLSQQQQQQLAQQVMSKAPIGQVTPEGGKETTALVTEMMKEREAQRKQEETEKFNTYRDETKQQFETLKAQNQQQFQEHMERLRETARDQQESAREQAMFKALGIRLSAEDQRRMQVTPAQINTEINGTLTSMRQQLSQASASLRSLQAQAQKRDQSLWQKMISDSPDVAGAQSQVKSLQAAIDYIEKNRTAIISGKAQLDDVVDQAQSIAMGQIPGEQPVK